MTDFNKDYLFRTPAFLTIVTATLDIIGGQNTWGRCAYVFKRLTESQMVSWHKVEGLFDIESADRLTKVGNNFPRS